MIYFNLKLIRCFNSLCNKKKFKVFYKDTLKLQILLFFKNFALRTSILKSYYSFIAAHINKTERIGVEPITLVLETNILTN